MLPYQAEFVGTLLLILLGAGANANVCLPETKGTGGGWIIICLGWGMAVFVAVWCVGPISGAHLNPAVTLGIAAAGSDGFSWQQVPAYVAAQFAGAFAGALLMYGMHYDHFARCQDAAIKRGVFCTAPAIRNRPLNTLSEAIGTAVLVLGVLLATEPSFASPTGDPPTTPVGLGTLGALPVGLLVLAIGLCLGGPTGYAINPARDLAPRLAHAVLPIAGKGPSDWVYSWVPVVGPTLGALLAAGLYRLLWAG